MKRTFGVFLMVIFFLATITTALCSDTSYNLPELYMTASLPDDYTVFTRDTEENDPNLADFGIDIDTLNTMFEQKNIYLNAISEDMSDELIITMVTNDDIKKAFNLKNASDKDMEDFLADTDSVFDGLGATLEDTSSYEHKQALFMVFDFSMTTNGVPTSSRMYSTIINGQFINITFHSYTGAFSETQGALLSQIVDSAVFTMQSSIDWTSVIISGLSVGLAAGIATLVVNIIKKRRQKKNDKNLTEPPVS